VEWLTSEAGVSEPAAQQVIEYLADGRAALGVIPTQDTLVLERFFDESGGMQLVLHAPFGSRINRAWALALRKRFCRQFNFELQAAANEDALLLSLGPQHSFPLADVFRYLHPATVRDVLIQAFLDAPVFATRWRWNATISLAVPRSRGGSKVPPQLQRMQADDLMAAAFPDAAACQDNLPGDREIPDHPLVNQTVRDCLEEAMDIDGLSEVLSRIQGGQLQMVSRDTPEPSVFAHEIVNSQPYTFLDDAPLEERRAHAVQSRRAGAASAEFGALDAAAIARVMDEARPDPRDADELHDVLLTIGFLSDEEMAQATGTAGGEAPALLAKMGRATQVSFVASGLGRNAGWTTAERLPEILALHPGATLDPPITAPPSRAQRTWTREEALVELLRGRLSIAGPTTATALAASIRVPEPDVERALLALESEGVVLRGTFTPVASGFSRKSDLEWCDRRLLSRIHRYTLNRLRAEIAPVTPAEFMRFLMTWQHVEAGSRLSGSDGLRAVLTQLDGVELPARAWERDVLAARVERYEPSMLDLLCLTGEVAWARLSSGPTQVVGATPVAMFLREHAAVWTSLASGPTSAIEGASIDVRAAGVLEHLRTRGASFAQEIAAACYLSEEDVRAALGELVAAGLVSSDGFAGLRSIIGTAGRVHSAGRWFPVRPQSDSSPASDPGAVETLAWTLLRRYGVIFRRPLAREALAVPWRDLARIYRRLEARGEIRGGRFVSGMSGEQFALPDAVERLREVRRTKPDDRLITISAADPLNLTGIITPGDRIRAVAGNRIVYRNGVPCAAMEGDMIRMLCDVDPGIASDVAAAAAGRRVPVVSGYVGRL
jgi:ATP-dependent Lhr-like helicase